MLDIFDNLGCERSQKLMFLPIIKNNYCLHLVGLFGFLISVCNLL